jgi:hypothetical protein
MLLFYIPWHNLPKYLHSRIQVHVFQLLTVHDIFTKHLFFYIWFSGRCVYKAWQIFPFNVITSLTFYIYIIFLFKILFYTEMQIASDGDTPLNLLLSYAHHHRCHPVAGANLVIHFHPSFLMCLVFYCFFYMLQGQCLAPDLRIMLIWIEMAIQCEDRSEGITGVGEG